MKNVVWTALVITHSLVSCSPAFPDVFQRCQQAKQTGVDIYFSLGLLQKGAARPLRPACCEDSRTGVCINPQQYSVFLQQYAKIHRNSFSAWLILWRRVRSSSTCNQRCQSSCAELCVAASQTAAGVEDTGSSACDAVLSCSGAPSFVSPPLFPRRQKSCVANAASLWLCIFKHLPSLRANSHYYVPESFSVLKITLLYERGLSILSSSLIFFFLIYIN